MHDNQSTTSEPFLLRSGPVAVLVIIGVGLAGTAAHLGSSFALSATDIASPLLRSLLVAGVDTALLAGFTWVLLVRPFRSKLAATVAEHERQSTRMRADARVSDFDSSISRAMEMAEGEQGLLDVAREALAVVVPGHRAELLLADNSQSHLRRAVATGDEGAGCPVQSASACAAARLGRQLDFHDSRRLDACPHLKHRGDGPIAATCSPVAVMGQTIGVFPTVHAPGDGPDEVEHRELELISHHLGARLSLVRALASSQLQAATDQLTGLANRRTFEDAAAAMVREGREFVVALGDLDHFKEVNDTYGHDAGDRALRAAALALRSGVRDDDLAVRHGGEEFVVLLPDCPLGKGLDIADRLRDSVRAMTAGGATPAVTITFGVTHSSEASDLEGIMRLADVALFTAKDAGRNRVLASADMADRDMPAAAAKRAAKDRRLAAEREDAALQALDVAT